MKYWTRQESKERFPKPITPLGWSIIDIAIESTLERMSQVLGLHKYARNELVLWYNFTIYTRKKFFNNFKNLKFDYPRIFQFFIQAAKSFFHILFKSSKEEGTFKNRLMNDLFFRLLGNQIEAKIKEWPSKAIQLKNIMGRDFKLNEIGELNYESFVKIRSQMQKDCQIFFADVFDIYFYKKMTFFLLKSQLISAGMPLREAEELIFCLGFGLKDNFSLKMIEDFNNKAISVEELKRRYGHLSDNWDLYNPTMGEVESVWENRSFERSANLSDEAKARETILLKLSWNKRVSELVEWFLQLVSMDHNLSCYCSLSYPQARRLMKIVEETKPWKEMIIRSDSVYFLHLNEIEYGLKKSNFHLYFDLIHERKNAFLNALKDKPPFDLVETLTGSLLPVAEKESSEKDLKGQAVFRGKKDGVVVHINEFLDLKKITKESILVVDSATAAYAPFYALSGGIISETEDSLSIGAIIARKYAIPMLSGVFHARDLLKEGQRVRIDSENEKVHYL